MRVYYSNQVSFLLSEKPKTSLFSKLLLSLFVFAGSTVFLVWFVTEPPLSHTPTIVTIEPGDGVLDIGMSLKEAGQVRSAYSFSAYVLYNDYTNRLRAGEYEFNEPLDIASITRRLVEGDSRPELVRVVHIEGQRVTQLAERLENLLPDFDIEEFIEQALPYEGKLFPDTYLIPPWFTTTQVIELLHNTYQTRLASLESAINDHWLEEEEIVILASILEREANSTESNRLVAGILLNRLAIDMPLQADASIEYVLDKPLSELRPDDLQIDSPYNTYLYRGLPPTPIGNPGLDTIMAVLEPIETEYLYYITDRNGDFHYAYDFDAHRQNIARYLR